MHRLEAAAETPAAHAALRRFELNLKSDPPPPSRVEIMQRLDETRGTTNLQMKIVTRILNAMALGLGAVMPPDLEAQSNAFNDKLRPVLAGNILVRNLFTYRNSDDSDVEDVVSAEQQKDVQWFNQNLQSAILAVAADRAARAGEAIKVKVSQPMN
jgi:hypothetical protein